MVADADAPVLDGFEAADQGEQRALARTRMAHDRDASPGIDLDGDVAEHRQGLRLARVPDGDFGDGDAGAGHGRGTVPARSRDVTAPVDHGARSAWPRRPAPGVGARARPAP